MYKFRFQNFYQEGNFHFTTGYGDIQHSKDLNRPVRGELCGLCKMRCCFSSVDFAFVLEVYTVPSFEITQYPSSPKVLCKYLRVVAERGCLHQEILLKKEKEILDYPSTKGKRGSIVKVLGGGLVHFYQRHACTLEERLLPIGSLRSVPPHTASSLLQQRHV